MPEAQMLVFTHRELAEALVKQHGLHEGLWGIYIEFAIAAANISQGPDGLDLLPAAIIPVVKVGLQRFPGPNSLTVDAAVVNPAPNRPRNTRKVAEKPKGPKSRNKESA